MKNIFDGGFVERQGFSRMNPFQIFMKMMNNKTCRIRCISYSSAYGFIFKLDIDPASNTDNREEDPFYVSDETNAFFQFNKDNSAYNKPVYSLVVKMVLLGIHGDKLPQYEGKYEKRLQGKPDFIYEGEAQSKIYKTTVLKGEPISLSVVLNSILDKDVALPLVTNILAYKMIDKQSRKMLDYIKKILENGRAELGILAMEYADGFNTINLTLENAKPGLLKKLKNMIYGDSAYLYSETRKNLFYKTLFMIIRLYIETGYIHKDMHTNNAMVKMEGGNLILRIIDFGIVTKPYEDKNLFAKLNPYEMNKELNRKIPENISELSRLIETVTTQNFLTTIIYYEADPILELLLKDLHEYYEKPNIVPDEYRQVETYYAKIEDVQFKSGTGGTSKSIRKIHSVAKRKRKTKKRAKSL